MPRVQFGPPIVRLRARRADLRGMRPRPDGPDDRPRPGMAGLRRRAGREARAHGRADDLHDPRQRPLDDDRVEEQGLVRQVDPDPQPRPALSAPEMATPDPGQQRDRAQPRVRPERIGPDGEWDGTAAERPGDGRHGVPQGGEQEPDPRAVDRGGRRGLPLCRVPPVQCPEDPRRDREFVPRGPEGDRPDLPIHDPRAQAQADAGEVQSRAVEILKDAQDKELTSGRGPTGVAAAAIYIASILCNERRTQREVADVAGVTEVTIRNRYKELTEKLGIKVEL